MPKDRETIKVTMEAVAKVLAKVRRKRNLRREGLLAPRGATMRSDMYELLGSLVSRCPAPVSVVIVCLRPCR